MNKTSLTKEERHRAYKSLLEIFISEHLHGYGYLCPKLESIAWHLYELEVKREDHSLYDIFPELLQQKPSTTGPAWWPYTEEGYQSRLQAIDRMIELTKPTYND